MNQQKERNRRICFICADYGRISFPPHLAGLPCPNGCLKEEDE